MTRGTNSFRFLLTTSAVLLAIAGILGWLLPGLFADSAVGTEAGAALADGPPSWISVVGILVVVVAAFLVALSGRRVIAIATELSGGDHSGSGRGWMGVNGTSMARETGAGVSTTEASGESRAVFVRRVRGEVARTSRYGHPLSLLSISVDQPAEAESRVPDPVANRILGTIGEIVQNNTRLSDAYGRTAPNRILVLLAETEVKGAGRVAEKLRRNVEVYPFDQSSRVTVSVGVATHRDGDEGDDLISRVETACDSAGAAGGNRVGIA